MVTVPMRASPVFAAALMTTVPLPLPLAPDVIVSHDALLVVVQAQPAAADTATLIPVVAVAAIDRDVG